MSERNIYIKLYIFNNLTWLTWVLFDIRLVIYKVNIYKSSLPSYNFKVPIQVVIAI